jgi:hypothetical protein
VRRGDVTDLHNAIKQAILGGDECGAGNFGFGGNFSALFFERLQFGDYFC